MNEWMHGQYSGHMLTIDYWQKGIQQTQLIFNYFKSKEINITLALFKEG